MSERAVVVHIRQTADGVVRAMDGAVLMVDADNDGLFIWEEGNFSCDCNRELFFRRAGERPEIDNPECGDTRYRIQIKDAATGEVLYDEWNSVVPEGE